jgi:hypothetical protein
VLGLSICDEISVSAENPPNLLCPLRTLTVPRLHSAISAFPRHPNLVLNPATIVEVIDNLAPFSIQPGNVRRQPAQSKDSSVSGPEARFHRYGFFYPK